MIGFLAAWAAITVVAGVVIGKSIKRLRGPASPFEKDEE